MSKKHFRHTRFINLIILTMMPFAFWMGGCSEIRTNEVDLSSVTPILPINHPPISDPSSSDPNNQNKATTVFDPAPQLATRDYIRSFFMDIFQNDSSTKTVLTNILDTYLGISKDFGPISTIGGFANIGLFGGGCSLYDEMGVYSCGNIRANVTNPVYVGNSPSREAMRSKLCIDVVDKDALIRATLINANLGNENATFNKANFEKLFDLFYPGIPLENATYENFANLQTNMVAKSESNLNKWRVQILTLCLSPSWQVL